MQVQVTVQNECCGDKRKYSKDEANRALSVRMRAKGGTLRKYQCQICGRWHLTHGDSAKFDTKMRFRVKKAKRINEDL